MAAPTRYILTYDFTAFQESNPITPLPADKIEIEFNNLQRTTDEIIDNLGIIQRSDGKLNNGIVQFESLSNTVKALLGSDINPRGQWMTSTAYAVLDLVEYSNVSYICAIAHTSGVFATDSAAGKWIVWAVNPQQVSIKDFGALGDGATDDTVAFQAAATAGGRIFVPKGTYIVDYVQVTTDVEFYGEGVKSIIKKKDNSCSQSYVKEAYLFNMLSANMTVGFTNLMFDGNYTGQTTTRTGIVVGNNLVVNQYNGSATNFGAGGAINFKTAVATSASQRLIVRVTNCKIYRSITHAIYASRTIDIGNYVELILEGNEFSETGPSIAEYHDGTNLYDGILYPACGYSFSPSGIDPAFVMTTNGVRISMNNNSFVDTRSPYAGTLTTGYDINAYNMPAVAVVMTSETGAVSDPTLEYSSLVASGNRFKGLGRNFSMGNGIGVIDFYLRGGEISIDGNVFEDCYESSIRGKSNAKNIVISNNVIDNENSGAFRGHGINITPLTYPAQRGNWVVTGNVIKNVSSGIIVTGYNVPPENSNPDIDDDTDLAANNVLVANNVIHNCYCPAFTNSVLQDAHSSYGWGIYARYINGITVIGNQIDTTVTATGSDGNEHGIYLRDCSGNAIVSNNTVKNTAQRGILINTHVGQASVTNNAVDTTGHTGIASFVDGVSRVDNNNVNNATFQGIVGGSSTTDYCTLNHNTVRNVSGSNASNNYGIGNGAGGTVLLQVMGNTVDGIANAGAGAAHGLYLTTTLDTANISIVRDNRISSTEESGIFATGFTGIMSGNVFDAINTSAATSQGCFLINGPANTGIITLTNNTTNDNAGAFPTTGGATLDIFRNAGRLIESLNSWNRREFYRSAVPTVGTFAVDDLVWFTGVTSGGNIGAVCTTAGTPGTWKTFGVIA